MTKAATKPSKMLPAPSADQINYLATHLQMLNGPPTRANLAAGTIVMYDEDGDTSLTLGQQMVRVLCAIPVDEAWGVVQTLLLANRYAFKRGERAGEQTIVNQVHRLLGIDKIVGAIEGP